MLKRVRVIAPDFMKFVGDSRVQCPGCRRAERNRRSFARRPAHEL